LHPAERPQEGAQASAHPFTPIAMHFALPVAIVITRPLLLSVFDGRVLLLVPVVTALFVRIDDRPFWRYCFSKNTLASGLVALADHPAALFATLAADNVNDRRPIVVVGARAWRLSRTTTWRVVRIAMRRTFFPLRSGTTRRPRRSALPSCRLEPSHSDWLAAVAARYGRFGARDAAHAPAERSIRPWQWRGARAAASPVAGGCPHKQCQSARYSIWHKPDSDRHHSSLGCGSDGGYHSHTAGNQSRRGADAAPTRPGTSYRQTDP